jgi:Uncharacterized protein conserved in bacteria
LKRLEEELGARVIYPLYGSADPMLHFPTCQMDKYAGYLSYLGSYARDRQEKLEEFFIKPALALQDKRFLLAGPFFPLELSLSPNISLISHVAPPEHSPFYCSSKFTLNITRAAMSELGYCASGRLFEAALCEVPILSDSWEGIETFFTPNEEIILVNSASDVIEALNMEPQKRLNIAKAGRRRVLREHTSQKRAQELMAIINRF